MWHQSAHDGEALRLPACAGACVRLRLSLRDRVLGALRWTLGLAGAVLVLWLGTAFLAAAPAAAAVAVPVAAVQQGLLKGGGIRPAGSGDGDSDSSGSDGDSGSSDDGGENKSEDDSDDKSEKKSEKKEDSDEKSEEKKDSDEKSEEKEDSDQESEKKDREKKDADEADDSRDDRDRAGDKAEKDQAEKQDDESGENAERVDRDRDEPADGDRDRKDGESDDSVSEGRDDASGEDTREDREPTDGDGAADSPDADGADTDGETAVGDEGDEKQVADEARDSDDRDGEADDRVSAAGAADATDPETGGHDGDADDNADDDRTAKTERTEDADDADDTSDDVRAVAVDRDAVEEAIEQIRGADRSDDADERDADGRDENDPSRPAGDSDDERDERRAKDREAREEVGDLLDGLGESVDALRSGSEDDDGDRDGDRDVAGSAVRAALDGLDGGDDRPSEEGDEKTLDSTDSDDDREDTSRGIRDVVRDALRSASDEADVSEDDIQRVVDTAGEELDRALDADGGAAEGFPGSADALDDDEKLCDDGEGCEDSESEQQQVSLLSERGPPGERSARESDDDEDEDRDEDDSAERTEQVLEDRIEVDNSKEELEQERQKVAAGTTTQADYDKKAAEHAELEKKAAKDRAEASEDDVELVDEVVDGHHELSKREKELAEEEKKVAAGSASEASHEKNVEDFEERRDDVYEATDELMEATGREVRTVSEDDLDGEGATAGCDSDGAFQGCGSASESADGERDSERRLCLSGVSSGCGASSESGGSKAEASCDDSGCGSSASSRGADGRETSASARCTGDCGTSTRADRQGSEASCDTAGGACDSRSRGSGASEPDVRKASTVDDGGGRVEGGGASVCKGSCRTSSSVDLDETVVADAEVACEDGCSGSASTTGDADKDAVTGGATSGKAGCTVSGGHCAARSAAGDDAAEAVVEVDCSATCEGKGTAITGGSAGAERASNGAASCVARGGACEGSSETRVDSTADGDGAASSTVAASVDCGDAGSCSGEAGAKTDGKVTGTPAVAGGAAPVRDTSAASTCAATDGGCASNASSRVDDAAARGTRVASGTAVRALTAASEASSEATCAVATCTGRGWNTTSGAASGDVAGVRSSTAGSSCTVHGAGGTCSGGTDTTVADREPAEDGTTAAVTGPVSVSNASASVECTGGIGECGGTSASSTSAQDTGVTPHARGTSATAECTVNGGGCSGGTSSAASSAPDFVVTDPATGLPVAGQPTAGPSSTSSSSASLVCEAGTTCTGSVRTSTSAFDGAVANGTPRTSEGTASCTGATGGCEVRSTSNASSGPGAALALAGGEQPVNAARLPAGPSAASAAGAAMTCAGETACTGTVTSAATATDPAVSPDPRGSHSEGSCEGVTGGVCQAVTNSAASSGPDANAIAPLVAERSTANATVTSGTTGEQAPAEQPQDGTPAQDEPATPPAPTAPGSSANSGAPTVPGASSWTMASATLDCAGGTACSGTARTSAAGSDGPATGTGANGARGPPEGGSTTSATCTSSQSGCRAQTSSTAASGQVVADIVAEQQNDAAAQLAMEAAHAEQVAAEAAGIAGEAGSTDEQKKMAADAATAAEQARQAATQAVELAAAPVTGAPATMSQSDGAAVCDGPDCAATAISSATTTGIGDTALSTSRAEGTCVGTSAGCAVKSSASAITNTDSGTPDPASPDPNNPVMLPGRSGTTQASAQLDCLEGCTGHVVSDTMSAARPGGGAAATAGLAGDPNTALPAGNGTATDPISLSVGHSEAGCTATDGPCATSAATSGSANVMISGVGRAATTSADAEALCSTEGGGCSVVATSVTVAGDDPGAVLDALRTRTAPALPATARAVSTAECAAAEACQVSTGGTGGDHSADVRSICIGAGCTTRAEGNAQYGENVQEGQHVAAADASCAGGDACVTSVMVGAGPGYAMAGAGCQGAPGVGCRYGYRAESQASAGGSATGAAVGFGSGTIGEGTVTTTAAADAGPGYAQASASCAGSANTNCSYSYSASVSASASHGGSWARASASGSGSGSHGGGFVAVTAYASAGPNQAEAGATCVGAPNCWATYKAHAEAYDRGEFIPPSPTEWGGYHEAFGWGTCGNSSSSGGGCGVQAWAQAGVGGGAECFGDCSQFVQDGGTSFVATTPPTGPPPNKLTFDENGNLVDEHGKIVPLGDVTAFIEGTCDAAGNCTLKALGPNGKAIEQECAAADCNELTVPTPTGETITYERGTGFNGSIPVEPGSQQHHQVDGTDGVRLARDKDGNAAGWVRGAGSVTDGRTGEVVRYANSVPQDSPAPGFGQPQLAPTLLPPPPSAPRNDFTLSTPGGSPFSSTCNRGCEYTGPVVPRLNDPAKRDHLVVTGTSGSIIGRTATTPAHFTWTGPGNFTSAEGDTVIVEKSIAPALAFPGTNRTVEITGRNAEGLGGTVILRDAVGNVHIPSTGVVINCQGCTTTHTVSTSPGEGGTTTCSVAGGGHYCEVGSPWGFDGDHAHIEVVRGQRGRADLAMFHRNADGSEGGIVAFTSGAGRATASDAYGHWAIVKGDRGGMMLGLAEDDGYNRIWSCSGSCQSNLGEGDRLPWVEPTPEFMGAMGYGPLEKPGAVDPLEVARPLLDRASTVYDYQFNEGHKRWMTENGNELAQPTLERIEAASADGVTPEEEAAFAGWITALGPRLLSRLGRTEEAVETTARGNAVLPVKTEDVNLRVANDPQLVADVLDLHDLPPDWRPSEQQKLDAKDKILAQQDISASVLERLDGFQGREDALGQRIAAHGQAIADYEAGRGGDYDALVAEGDAIEAEKANLAAEQAPWRSQLAESQGVLRAYDLASAQASGDPGYAADLDVAAQNYEAVQGLLGKLPAYQSDNPTDAQLAAADTISAFVAGAAAGYDAAIESPRRPGNMLTDMSLPSSLEPDLPLAMRSSVVNPYLRELREADSTPFMNPDGTEWSDDQLADFGATWIFAGVDDGPTVGDRNRLPRNLREIAGLPALPPNEQAAVSLATFGLQPGEEGYGEAIDHMFSRANVVNGSYQALADMLPERERGDLEAFADEYDGVSFSGFFKFMFDGSQRLPAHTVRTFNRQFGYDTDNFWKNVARDTVNVTAMGVSLPGSIGGGAYIEGSSHLQGIFSGKEARRPGESGLEYYTRLHPISGGIVTAVDRSVDRWSNGTAGADYHAAPISTFLEDFTVVLVVAAPVAGLLRRGAQRRAAQATVLHEQLRIARGSREFGAYRPDLLARIEALESGAMYLDRGARIFEGPARVAAAPFAVAALPFRAAAGATRLVTAPAAHATGVMTRAIGRRAAIAPAGRVNFWRPAYDAMDAVTTGFARTAEAARLVMRHGLGGMRQATGPYKVLRVRPAASMRQVEGGWRDRAARVDVDNSTSPIRAARQRNLDKAYHAIIAMRSRAVLKAERRVARVEAISAAIENMIGFRDEDGSPGTSATPMPSPRRSPGPLSSGSTAS